MTDIPNMTEEERNRVSKRIEYSFEFVGEILDNPSILDHIPSGATVQSIPKEERDPSVHYDIETPRMLAIVTPSDVDASEPAPRSNGRTRRIERSDDSRLRRIRAAHR
jgi:hypothetical protein